MNHEFKDFDRDVLERSHTAPVLVDFWAPWCGPCKSLGPVLERLAARAGGRWHLVKVNTEEHPDLAAAFSISSIPAVKLFVDGEVRDEFVGLRPESEIRRWLEKHLPRLKSANLATARELIGQGAFAEAAAQIQPVLTADPGHEEAALLLAEARLHFAPAQVEAALQPIVLESEHAPRAAALRTLAPIAALALDASPLPPGPARERFLDGARGVFRRDHSAALEAFIDVLQRDRAYAQGGAQAACKAIFQHLGPRHPIAEQHFRAFSSALYA